MGLDTILNANGNEGISHIGFENGDAQVSSDSLMSVAIVRFIMAFCTWCCFILVIFDLRFKNYFWNLISSSSSSTAGKYGSQLSRSNGGTNSTGNGSAHAINRDLLSRLTQTMDGTSDALKTVEDEDEDNDVDKQIFTSTMETLPKTKTNGGANSRINSVGTTTSHGIRILSSSTLDTVDTNNTGLREVVAKSLRKNSLPEVAQSPKRATSFTPIVDTPIKPKNRIISNTTVSVISMNNCNADSGSDLMMKEQRIPFECPGDDIGKSFTRVRFSSYDSARIESQNNSFLTRKQIGSIEESSTAGCSCSRLASLNSLTPLGTSPSSQCPSENSKKQRQGLAPIDPLRFVKDLKKLSHQEIEKMVKKFETELLSQIDSSSRLIVKMNDLDEKLESGVFKLEVLGIRRMRFKVKAKKCNNGNRLAKVKPSA
eukprot:TRINITY_DN1654_c0_g1_i5.p1 TRINITY_DN1654_c0_g1~~TRINITY_DN1654_c0_g1_i5.p1  ORF type:complete len:428 (+),score=129.91 TRINITY_DN1654_c0_g1_i5:103-1386(+)